MKTILIADRNPRILAYLKRELTAEGYMIHTINNAEHLNKWFHTHASCDLVIFDPDLFNHEDSLDLVSVFRSKAPLPVILHGLLVDCPTDLKDMNGVQFIPKSGASVESLKKAIAQCFPPEAQHNRV